MGRRKPTNVQRNKRSSGEISRVSAYSAGDGDGGEHGDACGAPLGAHDAHAPPRAKKRCLSAGFVDPTARLWERVMLRGDGVAPLQLTFRDAWTPLYRSDALWLEWHVQPPVHIERDDAVATLLSALQEAIAGDAALLQDSSSDNSKSDTVIGLEIHAPVGSITLRTASGPAVPTALTLLDVFPSTSAAWRAHVVHLVASELLVIELVLRGHSKISALQADAVWRVGVAWRAYSEHHVREIKTQLAPTRGASCRCSMHVVMLWLLTTIRAATSDATMSAPQCMYAYWKEIDVLCEQALGASDGESASRRNAAAVFDIHDVYARIDSARQLSRDTRNVDAALARSGSSDLLPTLRPYQRAAVSWMLAREAARSSQQPTVSPVSTLVQFPLACINGHSDSDMSASSRRRQLTYDPFCARFVVVDPVHMDRRSPAAWFDVSAVRGGILADEMGLGKTVEVIALVLCHPWSEPRPLLCSSHRALDVSEQQVDSSGSSVALDAAPDDASVVHDCICGSSEDEARGWVQCDFCATWHHQLCTGFSADTSSEQFDTVADGRSASEDDSAFVAGMFMCFHCQAVERPTFACKTTLIVSPEAIHDQWEAELRRHVKPGALKLLRYAGVRVLRARLTASSSSPRPSAEWQVLASTGLHLASYDVVLTTYEALSSDLFHVPTDALHARRASTRQRRKRYAFVASPLTCLRFWRVCMDEAQVGVENTQLQAALTVAQLRSELAWVVTGTPFSTQLGDLFGCFKYLRLSPFGGDDEDADDNGDGGASGQRLFRAVLETCFARGASERVLDLLLWDGTSYEQPGRADGGDQHQRRSDGGGLLWRTSKRDVLAQLELPAQASDVVWCRFSDVERHFYDEQERAIVAAVREHEHRQRIRDASDGSAAADRSSSDVTEKVWNDLLVLRQICCHPQVGSTLSGLLSHRSIAGERLGTGAGTTVLSMDAFLQELITKCKRECEDAQRQFLAAQNGLASLRIVTHETPAAVVTYVASIRVVQTNWPLFRADLLPRLHVLENLARCVRRMFHLADASGTGGAEYDSVEARTAGDVVGLDLKLHAGASNPKEQSLLPELPALTRAISADASEDAMRDAGDAAAIARECAALDACAQRIRRFYLLQVEAAHSAALRAFESAANTVDERAATASALASKHVLCSRSLWWLSALAGLDAAQSAAFADRVRARLLALGTPWATRFCSQFATAAGFRVAFVSELEALASKRARAYSALRALSAHPPSAQDIARSGNCRKCRDARDGPVCAHCTLYRELEALRLHLLGVDGAGTASTHERASASGRSSRGERRRAAGIYDDDDDSVGGGVATSAATTSSLLLEVFREVASCARAALSASQQQRNTVEPTPQDALRDDLELWTHIQREWTAAKKLLQAQHQRLGALDELEMATLQMRVRLEGEVVETAAEKLYKLEAHEVPAKIVTLESDRVVAELEMRAHVARLRFLLQMAHQRQPSAEAADTTSAITDAAADSRICSDSAREPTRVAPTCAVCFDDMDGERVMLRCAHTFCKSCVQQLTRAASNSLRCPTCRRVCSTVDAVVVRDTAPPPPSRAQRPLADAHITLARGGFGSKVDAIVRRVLALAQHDTQLKCLLFTQWQHMLEIVALHLRRHGVACFTYASKRTFHSVVTQFKRHGEPCVLALPFKVGANGLNLVEATEVLLVEPLLNASIEAQAINRVHRIGQTRRTRVHRFVVEDSVEERIYWLGQHRRRVSPTTLTHANEHKDNDDDDNGDDEVVAMERAPSKKEKEKLTLDDLHVLLDGRMRSATNSEGDGDADAHHPFWHEHVLLNGKTQSRLAAKLFIERLRAAQSRIDAQQEQEQEPPHTRLFDEELSVVVANEVVNLPHANALEQTQLISAELLELHRARLRDELDAWRSVTSIS